MGKDWTHQQSLTIKFKVLFDEELQRKLNASLISCGKDLRNQRLQWITTPPDKITSLVRQTITRITVPSDPEQASEMLSQLYQSGNDAVISQNFSQFSAILAQQPGAMNHAYMAEINLGINGQTFDKKRVTLGIEILKEAMATRSLDPGSTLYCIGNGWMALEEYAKAQDAYISAIAQLNSPELTSVAGQNFMNLGSVMEKLGNTDEAKSYYEKALVLDPYLNEAHFALALQLRQDDNPRQALEHLDKVIRCNGSALQNTSIQGWRIDLLFRENNIDGAFREINNLLGEAEHLDWAWPWCARLVSTYGKSTTDCTQKSLAFWHIYLRRHPEDVSGKVELLLCSCFLHESGNPIEIQLGELKAKAMQLTKCNSINYALLLDRVGHWAQSEQKWKDAEECYRIAYEADPEKYGYCLGTALNFLKRHQEALPILLNQAEKYLPDAMSWFQVAVAYEGVADIDRSISAYQQALKLEPDYELAWFNLGGLYWNSHDVKLAKCIWGEAVKRFPDHKLTKKLLRDLPILFK
jgi:tetratricopeptide (TPR) repeat protein